MNKIKYYLSVIDRAIKEHLEILSGKDKYRYIHDNGGLINKHILDHQYLGKTYYPDPYNKEIELFCINFFKTIKDQGISIQINKSSTDNSRFFNITSASTVDMEKIVRDLEYEVNRNFPH